MQLDRLTKTEIQTRFEQANDVYRELAAVKRGWESSLANMYTAPTCYATSRPVDAEQLERASQRLDSFRAVLRERSSLELSILRSLDVSSMSIVELERIRLERLETSQYRAARAARFSSCHVCPSVELRVRSFRLFCTDCGAIQ